MRHYAGPSFWKCYKKLPQEIQDLADKSFKLLKKDPQHPSLHFKKVENYWSVRIGKRYRALAVEMEKGMLWFWIGTHTKYDKLVK